MSDKYFLPKGSPVKLWIGIYVDIDCLTEKHLIINSITINATGIGGRCFVHFKDSRCIQMDFYEKNLLHED